MQGKAFVLFLSSLLLGGCSAASSQSQTVSPTKDCPQAQAALSGERLKNDNACMKEYGVPCTAIPHYIGPETAKIRGESRACVGDVFANFQSGNWVVAKDSKVSGTGEMIATACIAITL